MYFDRRLWTFTEGVRCRIAVAVLISLVSAAVGVARLALLGWLLAKVFQGAGMDELTLPFVAIAGVMVLRGGLEYWRIMIAHKTAALVQLHIRKRLYDKIIELGPAHFGLERTGDVIASMVDGVEQLETYFGQYLPQLIVAALLPPGIFLFVVFLDLPVAALLVGFALITLVAPAAFHAWDSKASLARGQAYGDFGAEFLDSVQGLATLKAFGQSGARARLLAKRAHDLFKSTMRVLATNSLSRGITDTGIAVGAAAALALGAYRVAGGVMSLEALLVVLMMGIEVFRPLRELRFLLHDGMLGQSAAQKIFDLLDSQPLIGGDNGRDDHIGRAGAAALEPSVAFEDVTFVYPGARRVTLQGLSFRVAAGERVAIVGPSGTGKSTILRLLLRLYDPQEGSVRIGGRDLRELGLDTLRSQLAVVSQDTYLFHGTVEDSLRFGKPDASQREIDAAVRAANAQGFIERLPQGYQTVIGERGVRLSGGQRQRIAIARALLRDAPILVLDEALSAVDAGNEAVIQQALDRLMQGRTTLIFAHRLSSVIDADRILAIEDGRIAETGTHDELMAGKGAYYRLMAEQARDTASEDMALLAEGTLLADGATARTAGVDLPGTDEAAQMEPTDAILRAEGLGWLRVIGVLMRLMAPWKAKMTLTFLLGVLRVCALIGVGVVSALVVAAVKDGAPFAGLLVALAIVAPLAGLLHWLESWTAHDMAFRLLAEMRIALFDKLDALAPAYLLRRRTGDLGVGDPGCREGRIFLRSHGRAHLRRDSRAGRRARHPGRPRLALGARARALPRGDGAESVLHAWAHRPPWLARPRSVGRAQCPRRRHHPGTRRDRRVPAIDAARRGLLRAHPPLPSPAASLLQRPDHTDRNARGRDRPRRTRRDRHRRAHGRGGQPGGRRATVAHASRPVGFPADLRDRQHRTPARRDPRCDAASSRGPRRTGGVGRRAGRGDVARPRRCRTGHSRHHV